MRSVLLLCLMTTLAASFCLADVPDPGCVRTSLDRDQRLLLIPDADGHPLASFTVTVLNYDCRPIENALVEILLAGLEEELSLCEGAVLTTYSDSRGEASFNIRGGGCVKATGVVTIRANQVIVRQFHAAMSPDYSGHDNTGFPGRSDLVIDPRDLAAFVAAYRTGGPTCHDYDNDQFTGPTDLGVFVLAYRGGIASCAAR